MPLLEGTRLVIERKPRFDHREYASLHPQRAVEWHLKRQRLEDEIRTTESRIAETTEAAGNGLRESAERFLQEVAEDYMNVDEEERRKALAGPLADAQRAYHPTTDPYTRHTILTTRVRPQIKALYGSFDAKRFMELVERYIKEHGPDDDARQRLAELSGRKASLAADLESHLDSYAGCFVDGEVPSRWRHCAVTAAEEKDADRQRRYLATAMIESFVQDWTMRVRCFKEPVCIHGYALSTMPPEVRDEWEQAWNLLGLKAGDYVLFRYKAREFPQPQRDPPLPGYLQEAAKPVTATATPDEEG